MRALLYARQSVEKDGGAHSLSLDSQVAQLTARCQAEGWTIAGVIREAGLKGWMDADERPGLAEAIARAEARDIDVLLVWDLSRLARSVRLQEHWFWTFARCAVAIVSHTEPESGQSLIRQVKGAINEWRTEEIRAHTRRTIAEKQARGHHHGNVPWGYVRRDARQPLAIDAAVAAEVRAIFARRADGVGPAALARDLSRRGVPTPSGLGSWRACTVSALLRRATYRGAVCGAGGCTEGAHDPIVDPALWHAVQQRHQRRAPRVKAVASWLEGQVLHGCGLPMYLIQSHAGRQPYLRCRFGHAGIAHAGHPGCPLVPRRIVLAQAEAAAWEAVTAALAHLLDPAAVVAEARRQYARDVPAGQAAREEAQERSERARARRERFVGLYGDGVIDRAWLDVELAQLDAVLAEAEAVLRRVPEPPDAAALEMRWRELDGMRTLLAHVLPAERGGVLRALGTIVIDGDGVRVCPHAAVAGFFAPAHHSVG